jgi:hypothetical protein
MQWHRISNRNKFIPRYRVYVNNLLCNLLGIFFRIHQVKLTTEGTEGVAGSHLPQEQKNSYSVVFFIFSPRQMRRKQNDMPPAILLYNL